MGYVKHQHIHMASKKEYKFPLFMAILQGLCKPNLFLAMQIYLRFKSGKGRLNY